MISVFKRREPRGTRPPDTNVASDPAARFAYDLATKPPTKNVASVKAATDIFEANRRDAGSENGEVHPQTKRPAEDG